MKKIILGLCLAGSTLFGAGETVIIDAWGDYPTPSCKTTIKNKNKFFLIPHGTKAKVIDWGKLVVSGSDEDIYARIAMYNKIKVKIISGPLKGKKCEVNYLYLRLK